MHAHPTTRTRASLLGRLRGDVVDPDDWAAFFHCYWPLVHTWCRSWGLQEADAQDVAQDVLTRLASRMRTFEYDPSRSFRAYVKTLAQFTWRDLLEARRRAGPGGSGDSDVLERLENVAARDDLDARLADAFHQELLGEASASSGFGSSPGHGRHFG